MRLPRTMRTLLLSGLVGLAGVPAAGAAPITLGLDAGGESVPYEGTSTPCIISGTRCENPAGFGYRDYVQGGNVATYAESSPVYLASSFPFRHFDVGIDVNTARGGELLDYFRVLVDLDGAGAGFFTPLYAYEGDGAIGRDARGRGYADWLLGTVDLRALPGNAEVRFDARWTGASGGSERFFLVAREAQALVEPATFSTFLLGALAAVGLARRGRRTN
ncbi:MAG: hypothetical protein EHM60_05410 [Lysobacterales bacterium]|nr:MAG: hypothetical protein EHM60_05410 [Xanthomonadales bacterium]